MQPRSALYLRSLRERRITIDRHTQHDLGIGGPKGSDPECSLVCFARQSWPLTGRSLLPPEEALNPSQRGLDGVPKTLSQQGFAATLLLCIIVCTYLHIPLVSGGRLLIPSFPAVALAPLLFLTIRRHITAPDIVFLISFGFLLIFSIAFSPGHSYVTEKAFSLVQCCIAVAITVATVRLMLVIEVGVLERTLLALLCLIVFGSILEVVGITKDASDAFRQWAYEGTYTLYHGDDRDMNFVGWLRPKVFSTEPSHVTTLFVTVLNAWLLLRVNKQKLLIAAIATVVMFTVMGSPMYVVSAAITFSILVWNQKATRRTKTLMVLFAILLSIIFVAVFGESTLSTVTQRLDRIGDTTAGGQLDVTSENLRVVFPYLILFEVWSQWPVFGAGIGGKEVVAEGIFVLQGADPRVGLGTNGLAQGGIYLGILGVAWFLWIFLRHAGHIGIQRLGLLLVLVGLMAQLQGGVDSIRFWGFISPLWGALAVADRQMRKLPTQPKI